MEYIDNHLDELLKEWGKWAQSNPHSLNYPSMAPFRKLYKMGNEGRFSINISDEEALRIDRAMAAMKRANESFFKATMAFYVFCFTYSEIGELMNIHRKHVAQLVQCGVNFINGVLNSDK